MNNQKRRREVNSLLDYGSDDIIFEHDDDNDDYDEDDNRNNKRNNHDKHDDYDDSFGFHNKKKKDKNKDKKSFQYQYLLFVSRKQNMLVLDSHFKSGADACRHYQ